MGYDPNEPKLTDEERHARVDAMAREFKQWQKSQPRGSTQTREQYKAALAKRRKKQRANRKR